MTLDRAAFQAWLDRYVDAWRSYDAAAIGALFAPDAEYRYHPKDDPVRGRDAIVADWLEDRDDAGTYEAAYEVLAIDGEQHVAVGWTRYFTGDGTLDNEYSNIYLCRFDAEGRCSSFTEWWIQDREFARRDRQRAAAAGA